ncbi:hypothetical protein ELG97_03105 [Rhizobium leguminosarum]|nr:hypothetical protein ELG97_03105 [Rhizobium leguminosarum]
MSESTAISRQLHHSRGHDQETQLDGKLGARLGADFEPRPIRIIIGHRRDHKKLKVRMTEQREKN